MTLPRRTLVQHLDPSVLPKRILSLDGGGVRGILSLQYLRAIESLLRQQYDDASLVLSDYFDLIGGTSTGAIIAAGLALGKDIDELERLYTTLATKIFKKPFFRIGAFSPKFGKASLQQALQDAYGADTKLGSPLLKTGLMVMTKRMDTGSPWPITNQPLDEYFLPREGKKRIGHTNMLLWQIVRASTAAPHYFKPEDVVVGSSLDPATGQMLVDHGQFVDGGVSPANNPSLQLLKVALLDGFKFGWKSGEDNLLVVSVGTGLRRRGRGRATGWRATAGAFAFSALLSLMDDCNNDVETVMQWLSRSPNAREINGQIKALSSDLLTSAPVMHYLRYNLLLEEQWMKKPDLQISLDQPTLDRLSEMDKPGNMRELAELGRRAAAIQVKNEHFPLKASV